VLIVHRHTLGVVLVGGGLLHSWVLVFVGGCRIQGRSRQWGVVASMGARVQGWCWGLFLSVGGCYGGVPSLLGLFVLQGQLSSMGSHPSWVGDGRCRPLLRHHCVAASSSTVVTDMMGCAVVVVVVCGRQDCGQWCGGVVVVEGAGVGKDGDDGG
jgi:hypothetical protein